MLSTAIHSENDQAGTWNDELDICLAAARFTRLARGDGKHGKKCPGDDTMDACHPQSYSSSGYK